MKKLVLVATLFFCLLFPSCRGQEYGILPYQDKNIDAECTLNSEYKIRIVKENGRGHICFLEPTELSTISFSIEDERVTGNAGETKIPLPEKNTRGILAIFNMFSLKEGEISSARQEGSLSYIEFTTSYGVYSLTLGKNSMPKNIKIVSSDYTFDISIDTILLK